MYTFADKSNRKLCLRPEFTSSVLRAFLNNKQTIQSTQHLYYFGSAYRYERPQHGRYREFHQFGGEIMNCNHAIHDTEILSLCYGIIQKLKLISPASLEINCLGSTDCMKQYRDVLFKFLQQYSSDLSEESQNRLARGSVLRVLDSKQEKDQVLLQECPSILPYLSSEDRQRFDQLQEDLSLLNIPFTVNPRLVRGLDYYDNLVFEFTTETGSVIGGGSYSQLARSLGSSRDVPCIGFSAGIERCMLLSGLTPPTYSDGVGIVLLGSDVHSAGVLMASQIRSQGINVLSFQGSVKKALREMEMKRIRYAVILGENELDLWKQSKVVVKDMKLRQQREMDIQSFIHLVACNSE